MFKLYRTVFLLGLALKMAVAADDFKDLVDPPEEFERIQSVMREGGIATEVPIELLKANYMDRVTNELFPLVFYRTELFCWHHLHYARSFGKTIRSIIGDSTSEEMVSILDHWKERRHALMELVLTKRMETLSSDADKESCHALMELNAQARSENVEFYRLNQGLQDALEGFVDPSEDLPIIKSNSCAASSLTREKIKDTFNKLKEEPLPVMDIIQLLNTYSHETFLLDGTLAFGRSHFPTFDSDSLLAPIIKRWTSRREDLICHMCSQLEDTKAVKESAEGYVLGITIKIAKKQIEERRGNTTIENISRAIT